MGLLLPMLPGERRETGNQSSDAVLEKGDINSILYDIADTQSRHLSLKVECISLVWKDIPGRNKIELLDSMRKETLHQRKSVEEPQPGDRYRANPRAWED